MPDQVTVAHYTLTSKLGEGGMGEVYRATDTRLDREVAIKILPAALARDGERLARFKREAKVLASLNHPNIATIHGVEEGALVMELIEGDTLVDRIARGPIPVDEALKIADQIAAALEYAHEHGVVHRDLKPANVKAGQRVKVLDFGLAKVQEAFETDSSITAATRTGMVLGTAAYMSPEQAAGRAADARSDIFSFGVLLYEMLSAKRAFGEDTPVSTMAAILHKEPKPLRDVAPRVPQALDSIVSRCMAKDPSGRFQQMSDARKALRDLEKAAPPKEETPSIAVLPFANLSADKENEYFSDGLAEEILIALSRVKGLEVAARSSSFFFKGRNAEPAEIAAKLHVAHVLDGTVRRAGNRIRVTAQLVDARRGFQLWSERYDRQMEDIFDLQDEIARSIAEQLKVTLVGTKRGTNNVEAYEMYLKGRHLWYQRQASTVRQAIRLFEQAIELDPDFALPYAGLADCYGIMRVYGWIPEQESKAPALAAVTRAKKLDPESSEVSFSLGFYDFYFTPHWRNSGPHFEKAIAINPQNPFALVYRAAFLALTRCPDEAVRCNSLACKIDPLNPYVHSMMGACQYLCGGPDMGLANARHALELQPDYHLGMWVLGNAQIATGHLQEAIETLERLVAISRPPLFVGLLGGAYGRAGRTDQAHRLLAELDERQMRGEYVSSSSILNIHAGLGDLEEIRKWLARSLDEGNSAFLIGVTSQFFLDEFRSDPEVNRLMVGLYGY